MTPNTSSTTLGSLVEKLVGSTPYSGAKLNGLTSGPDFEKALQTTGFFSGGEATLGLDSGLVISADRKLPTSTQNFSQVFRSHPQPAGSLPATLFTVAQAAIGATSVESASTLEFTVTPTSRYLKITYSLIYTEEGFYSSGSDTWAGPVFSYPDGVGIFVRPSGSNWAASQNCAVIPTTTTYVTMSTAGIVPRINSGTPAEKMAAGRTVAQENYERLLNGAASTPPRIAYATYQALGLDDRFATVPLTCVVDLNGISGSVDVGLVVANLGDGAVPPLVLFGQNSIGFSSTSTATPAAEEASPTPAPVAVPPAPKVPRIDTFASGPVVAAPGRDLVLTGARLNCTTQVQISDRSTSFSHSFLATGQESMTISIPSTLGPGRHKLAMDTCDGNVVYENLIFVPKPPVVFEAVTTNSFDRMFVTAKLQSFVLQHYSDYNSVECIVNSTAKSLEKSAAQFLESSCKLASMSLAQKKGYTTEKRSTHKPANIWIRVTLTNK